MNRLASSVVSFTGVTPQTRRGYESMARTSESELLNWFNLQSHHHIVEQVRDKSEHYSV